MGQDDLFGLDLPPINEEHRLPAPVPAAQAKMWFNIFPDNLQEDLFSLGLYLMQEPMTEVEKSRLDNVVINLKRRREEDGVEQAAAAAAAAEELPPVAVGGENKAEDKDQGNLNTLHKFLAMPYVLYSLRALEDLACMSGLRESKSEIDALQRNKQWIHKDELTTRKINIKPWKKMNYIFPVNSQAEIQFMGIAVFGNKTKNAWVFSV
jgi:hypothetical protein